MCNSIKFSTSLCRLPSILTSTNKTNNPLEIMNKAKVRYENSEDSSSFLLFGNPLMAPLVSGEGRSSGPQDLTENQLTTISGPISSSSALAISSPAEEDFPSVRSTNIIQDLPYSS